MLGVVSDTLAYMLFMQNLLQNLLPRFRADEKLHKFQFKHRRQHWTYVRETPMVMDKSRDEGNKI